MRTPIVVQRLGSALLVLRSRLPQRARWVLDGEWPEPFATARRRRLSQSPVTYTQKLAYKFARDRRPLLTTLSDKLLARDYVSSRVRPGVLVPLLASAERAADIPWDDLPREFVCKVNHGSGGVIVVSDLADPRSRLPGDGELTGWDRFHVRPEAARPEDLARLCDFWLGCRYGWEPGYYREWGYRDVRPRVFVEEFCRGASGLPDELKVHCFNGVPRSFILRRIAADLDGVTERYLEAESDEVIERAGLTAEQWLDVLDMCRRLSAETDMVRIDFMVTVSGLRFSELTNYPGGGMGVLSGSERYSPDELELLYGSFWQVPPEYR